MSASHTLPHTSPVETRNPMPDKHMGFQELPLQGSNLDSPDPESDARPATLGANLADSRQKRTGTDSGHTLSHTVRHPCRKCGENREDQLSHRRRNGRYTRQPYCKSCQVEYHRSWRATAEGRRKMRAGVAASKRRYPEKERARSAYRYALLAGHLTIGPCYADGPDCEGKIEAHHVDYSKPLDVVWTCRRHHRALDRQRRNGDPKSAA